MPRFKDLPKTHAYVIDQELQTTLSNVEQELKGSVNHIIKAEPAIIERPPELVISEELSNLKAGLAEVKEDLKHIMDLINKIEKNGLRMKPQW